MTRDPMLAGLTTLRVGGPAGSLIEATTEDEFIKAIRNADDADTPVLVLGGGSNVVCSDDGFEGAVVRDARTDVSVQGDDAADTVTVTASAGTPWDEVASHAADEGWMGIEALAGIPGSVGATPVQNVGAYGREVADVISSVRVWDRAEALVRQLSRAECRFAYRHSLLKASMKGAGTDGRVWHPTPRFVVLEVSFRLKRGTLSAPIAYGQLADSLGIEVGECSPIVDVRKTVLALRRAKGMVLDPSDHDTWSVGSFFTNPILAAGDARRLPQDAPRYPAGDAAPTEAIKTSAAWLIEHAGFPRGFALTDGLCQPEDTPAALSTKHALALTNRDGATAADIVALARHVRDGVQKAFGVTLEPEPVLVGIEL